MGFRIVHIPFFGIAIPLITGMVNVASLSHWQIKLSFVYTIVIAFVIWQGNRYLLFSLQSYFDWLNKPVKKIIALLLAVSFFTIPVSYLMLIGWYRIFAANSIDWNVVFSATLIVMICVIFITHVYETVFLVKKVESDKLRNEQLERSKVQAELEALKNQIDPHFIFNSLNTLSYLIQKDAAKATLFNNSLADVYRYILQSKTRDLVLLREEMNFMADYFSLLKIRFEEAVEIRNTVEDGMLEAFLIPPISIQVLMENVVKHNDFSDLSPLVINITFNNNMLVIKNEIRKRTLRKPSSQVGLQNLNERYRLITNQSIQVVSDERTFEVWLPLLKNM